MKVLVTGSQGFLGKHACAALKQRGHEVVGLDMQAGADLVADITGMMPLMQVDAVVHLAAVAAPTTCDKLPIMAFTVNVHGTHQVLRLALESGAKKFVFSSSAHVYGISPKYLPTGEYHPLWMQNTYTTTKILGEQLCRLFHDNHGLSYTTLRLYNAYGPGQGPGYFIPDFIARAAHGPLNLKGGNTTKDFVYVTDVAEAFCRAVETSYVGEINIGTGRKTRLDKVVEHIGARMGVPAQFQDGDNATDMQADYSRATAVLDWKPTVALEDGLDATISGFKTRKPVRT